MRDHDDCVPHLVQPVKQPEHLFSARLIECTGRLVSEQQSRLPDKRPRDRHSLLLSSGEFTRLVVNPFRESEHLDRIHAHLLRLFQGQPPDEQWHHDILGHIIGLDEMVLLKNEADLFIPDPGQLLLLRLPDADAVEHVCPGIRFIHTADHIHQGTLSGTGRTQDREEFPLLHLKTDIL